MYANKKIYELIKTHKSSKFGQIYNIIIAINKEIVKGDTYGDV